MEPTASGGAFVSGGRRATFVRYSVWVALALGAVLVVVGCTRDPENTSAEVSSAAGPERTQSGATESETSLKPSLPPTADEPSVGPAVPAAAGATLAQSRPRAADGSAPRSDAGAVAAPKPRRGTTAQGASLLKFSDLYSGGSARGLEFSPKLKSLDGARVEMAGYMAPPLKPLPSFFVLTKQPMAVCPFCSTDADWPDDIVLVIMPSDKPVTPTEKPVKVRGRLEIGSKTDPETGFVSLIRIYASEVKVLD